MSLRINVLVCLLAVLIYCIECTYTESKELPGRTLVSLAKEAEREIVKIAYDCAERPQSVPCFFSIIRKGKYRCDDEFMKFWFCTLTKSNFVDESTGMFNATRTGAIFPKRCKVAELFEKCSKIRGFAAFDTFKLYMVCFQTASDCIPNLPTTEKDLQ